MNAFSSLTRRETGCDRNLQRWESQNRDVQRGSALQWYVGEAEHQKIYRAAAELKSTDVETFLPTTLQRIRDRVNGERAPTYSLVSRPLLFQFFFIRAAPEALPRRDTRLGFRGILAAPSGRRTACIPGEVEDLIVRTELAAQRAREAFDRDMNPRKLPRLPAGAMVRVTGGIMEGKGGEVERCNGLNTVVWLTSPTGARMQYHLLRAHVSDE